MGPRAVSTKLVYLCNVRLGLISQSICPWQAFPAQPNVCKLDGARQSGVKVLALSCFPLGWKGLSEKNAITYLANLLVKKKKSLCEYIPWGQCYKTFYVRNLRSFIQSQTACQTRQKKLAWDKHYSSLQKFVNY